MRRQWLKQMAVNSKKEREPQSGSGSGDQSSLFPESVVKEVMWSQQKDKKSLKNRDKDRGVFVHTRATHERIQ